MNRLKVYLEITTKCNLNCPYCYNSSSPLERDEMEYSKIVSVLDMLLSYGVDEISISGGEPLLHTRIHSVLKYLCDKRCAVRVITNGQVLDEHILELLVANGQFHLQISLDGHDKATNDAFRGVGSFDNVISLLNRLKQKHYTHFSAKMVVNAVNYLYIDDYISFVKTTGGTPIISFMINEGRAKIHHNLKIDYSVYCDLILQYSHHIPDVAEHLMYDSICPIMATSITDC